MHVCAGFYCALFNGGTYRVNLLVPGLSSVVLFLVQRLLFYLQIEVT